MNAIVVTFDRLPVGFLGCYGNGWIDTPHFDRLASQSVVFDQHFAENLAPADVHAWWSGRYECRRSDSVSAAELLPATLKRHGVGFRLVCEPAAGDASWRRLLRRDFSKETGEPFGLDVAPEDTPLGRLVARAERELTSPASAEGEPSLLWLGSEGVPIPWLPSRAFACKYLDVADDDADDESADDGGSNNGTVVEMSDAEFDAFVTSLASLPETARARAALTDVERRVMRCVLGGYVAMIDAAFGRLLDQIDRVAAETPTLLIVTAAQGVTVREAGLLSGPLERLAEEVVHTPLFIRPAGVESGSRRQSLAQPVDLFPTLAEWFGVDVTGLTLEGHSLLPIVRGASADVRERAFLGAGRGTTGIRTSEYYLVPKPDAAPDDDDSSRLFVKPEDVWEVNDLAAQSPDVARQLSFERDQFFDETRITLPHVPQTGSLS